MKDIKEHQKVLTCFFLLCPWIYCERASFEAFGENRCLVAKFHRLGVPMCYCSCGSRVKEVNKDWWERSVCSGSYSMELSLAFVLLNYSPLGHQWRGSEKPLKHSVHILAVFRVKKGRAPWLLKVILPIYAGRSEDFNHTALVVHDAIIAALCRHYKYLETSARPADLITWLQWGQQTQR